MKIIGISGSLRSNSLSQAFLEFLLKGMEERGFITSAADLKILNLPLYNPKDGEEEQNLAAYKTMMEEADGILIINPEYHGSISGALKNALDYLEAKKMVGKVAALVSILGGEAGGFSLEHLTTVARKLHLWVSPATLIIPKCETNIGKTGEPLTKELKERAAAFLDKFEFGLRKLKS